MDRLETNPTLGGFAESVGLLEFDQIRQELAGYTRTVMGREATLYLTPSTDLLEIVSRQQETSEARQFLAEGGALEFGPASTSGNTSTERYWVACSVETSCTL